MNALEALCNVIMKNDLNDGSMRRLMLVKRELEALEIIKEHKVEIAWQKDGTAIFWHTATLDNKQMKLLKEVLS